MADKVTFTSDPTEELIRTLQRGQTNTAYRVVMDYLAERKAVPPIRQAYLGDATTGTFTRGEGLPKTGVVSVTYNPAISTVVHEMTHAADDQVEAQYYDSLRKGESSPASKQFQDAFRKVKYDSGSMFGRRPSYPLVEFVKNIATDWYNKNTDYRSTVSELLAFGTGTAAGMEAGENSRMRDPTPAHVDPTIATQTLILLDLAAKASKAGKSAQSPKK